MQQEFRNPFKLDNEIALITGGGTGIGFGIAKAFVNFGAKVIIAGRREEGCLAVLVSTVPGDEPEVPQGGLDLGEEGRAEATGLHAHGRPFVSDEWKSNSAERSLLQNCRVRPLV